MGRLISPRFPARLEKPLTDKGLQDHLADVAVCIKRLPVLRGSEASGIYADALAEAMVLQDEFIFMLFGI